MSEDSDQEAWLLRVLGVGLKVGRQSRSDNVIQSATTTSSFLESAMLDWESASDAAYSALDEARAEYKRRGGKEHLYAAALIARLQQQLVAPIHGADAAAKLESELKANQALALLDHELGIRAALLKTAGEIVAAYGREGQ